MAEAWPTSSTRWLLISKLPVVDPAKRISISEIMRNPWFQKGFARPIAQYSVIQNDDEEEEEEVVTKSLSSSLSTPPFYNAFEFISSMSSGFDLSSISRARGSPG